MPTFFLNLTNYLVKHYNINSAAAMTIVDDEWHYIEEECLIGNDCIETIAKNLIDIYMVA